MLKRALIIFAVALLLLGGLLTSGGAAGGGAPTAIVILNDGQVLIGQPFMVDEQTLSVLTDQGTQTLSRATIHSLSFLTPSTLVLRAEGTFTGENQLEGKIFYVGDLRDGRVAGTFSEKIEADPSDSSSGRLMVRTTHMFSDGSTLSDWAICNCGPDRPMDSVLSHQLAGVVVGSSELFTYAQGTVNLLVHINVAKEPATTVDYFIFHFREPIN